MISLVRTTLPEFLRLESDGKGSALYYWDKGTYRVIPTSD